MKNGILFLLSMMLVVGFWGHSAFYDLGLVPLVLIGGAVTFVFLRVLTWANDTALIGKRPDGVLVFRPEEVKLVQYGSKTLIVRPLRKTRMRAGSVFDAKLSVVSDRPFARLLITDVYRKQLDGLSDEELHREGSRSHEAFHAAWRETNGGWDPQDIVRVIEFRTLRNYKAG